MASGCPTQSTIYTGLVRHSRLRPKKHKFTYRVFSLLIDLDQLDDLGRSLSLFGYNRASVLSFHDVDHGNGERGALKRWVSDQVAAACVETCGLKVFILCYPRIFGYVFNPLTIYFCYDENRRLVAFLYEVSNTFGERHTYVVPVSGGEGETIRQRCDKRFHVSPFIPMECVYNFEITLSDDKLAVSIFEEDKDGLLLVASFTGSATPMTNQALNKAFLAHPLMTAKVSASILWEAFHLWRKRLPLYRHRPASSKISTSIVAKASNANPSEK